MTLRSVTFKGPVLAQADAGYDPARAVFNGLVDRRPARIMQCLDADDVAAAILSARNDGLQLSVYGGGHGVTGSAVVDGGVCVDVRGIDHVGGGPDPRTARIGGGGAGGKGGAPTPGRGGP